MAKKHLFLRGTIIRFIYLSICFLAMNKKFKNLFLAGAIVLGLAGVAVSCTDYDGDINDLTERVKKLESTVSDLQTAINNGAVITDVTPITNGVKVTLSNGKSFDVTNGKDGNDGKDGAPGKDGSVVTIGANGNWFIDGKDTGFASKGDKGDKGDPGKDGKDGAPGKDGKDGNDGAPGTPGKDGVDGKDALQIWYQPCTDKSDANYGKWVKYTYDPATKQTTSEVTSIDVFPEGTITAVYDEESGKITFHNVEGAKDGVVEISLLTTVKSLALIPEALMEGLGYIEFPYGIIIPDEENDDYVFYSSGAADVTYRLNPENADVNANEWAFINRKVKTIHMDTRSASDKTDLVSIVSENQKPVVKGGEATFSIKLNDFNGFPVQRWLGSDNDPGTDNEPEDLKNDIIALQTYANGETITSDYAYVGIAGLYAYYGLIHKDFTTEDVSPIDKTPRWYRTKPIAIEDPADDELFAPELPTPELLYTETLDLKQYVTLGANGYMVDPALAEDLGIDVNYKFELVNEKGEVNKPFLGIDKRTDQNKFVTLSEDGVIAVDPEFLNESTRPAVNRTPQVKVTATTTKGDKKYTLATCYIMIRIVEKKVEPEKPVTYFWTATEHTVTFCGDQVINFANPQTFCPDNTGDNHKNDNPKGDKLEVTWEEVNKSVLGKLGLSYEAFLEAYNTDEYDLYVLKIDEKGDTTYLRANDPTEYQLPVGLSKIANAPEEWATSTNVLSLFVGKDVKIPSKGTIEFVYKAKKNSKKTPHVGFKFNYEVTPKTPTKHEHDFVTPVKLILNPDYLLGSQNVPVETKPESKFIPSVDGYTKYAGVRVKGKAGADKNFTYSSSLIEHFEEYGKNIKIADDATISFEIMHSDNTWKVNYADDAYKFITPDGNVDKVEFTAAQFKAIIANPATSPDIKFMNSILTEDTAVLVKVTEKCTSDADVITPAKEKVGYYYVVFQTPFKVITSNKDVELGTFKKEADLTYIPTDIKVVEKENEKNVIFTFDKANGKMIATDYAKSQYGLNDLDGSVTFKKGNELTYPYENNTKDSFGGCLTYGSDTEGLYVAWDNLGTDLLVDKYADYNLVVRIGDLYNLDLKGKVTVLSTKNTQAKWPNGRSDKK